MKFIEIGNSNIPVWELNNSTVKANTKNSDYLTVFLITVVSGVIIYQLAHKNSLFRKQWQIVQKNK